MHDISAQNSTRINVGVNAQTPDQIAAVTNNPITTAAFDVYSKYGQVAVSSTQVMASFAVSNMTGRMLYSATGLNTTEFKSPTLNVPHQMLAVSVSFANGTIAIRKVQLLN